MMITVYHVLKVKTYVMTVNSHIHYTTANVFSTAHQEQENTIANA